MKDLIDSFRESIANRHASAFLGTFGITWLVLHWQSVHATFFTGEQYIYQSLEITKDQYVRSVSDSILGISHVPLLGRLAITFAITCFLIWVLPNTFTIWAFAANERHKVAKINKRIEIRRTTATEEKLTLDAEKEVFEAEKAALDAEKDALVAERRALQEKLKVTQEQQELDSRDPESAYSRQFDEVINDHSRGLILELAEHFYENSGNIYSQYDSPTIKGEILAFADLEELIALNEERSSYSLTDKGRYFVRRVVRENNPPSEEPPSYDDYGDEPF